MEITTYSNFRQNLKAFLDKVSDSKSPVSVTRSNGRDVVALSRDEYEGMQETLHLASNPKNAQRLRESIKEFKRDRGQEKGLIEE